MRMSSFVNVECHVFISQCVGFKVRNCYELLNLDTWRSLGSAVIAARCAALHAAIRSGRATISASERLGAVSVDHI